MNEPTFPAVVGLVLLLAGALPFSLAGCLDGREQPGGGPSLWSGQGSGGGVATGGCAKEGAVRECHIELGVHEGVQSCFVGQQQCQDGVWGECSGELTDGQPPPGAPDSDGAGGGLPPTRAITDAGPSSHASGCDVCEPYCMGYPEDPPDITPAWASTPGSFLSGYPIGGVPPGFQGKQTCAAPCDSGFTKKCNGSTHYNRFDACQADSSCNATSHACARNAVDWTWPTSVCPTGGGPDLTIGYPCLSGGTQPTFPLCNRGNTTVPSATAIAIYITNGNGYDWSNCNVDAGSCSITLSADLVPGACVQILDAGPAAPGQYVCPAWTNGNQVAMVNSNGAIAECGGATGPGCFNNWADIKKNGLATCTLLGGGYETLVDTETYEADCPAGSQAVWGKLYWEGVIACSPGACDGTNESSITFGIQTGSSFDGETPTFAPATPIEVAAISSANPTVCLPTTTPTASCPVFLSGGAIVQGNRLRLTTTLSPSPDRLAAPTLAQWQITYHCLPAE